MFVVVKCCCVFDVGLKMCECVVGMFVCGV